MRQQVGVDRLLATDETLTDEILLQFARLGGEGLRDAANAAVVQRGEAAEMQFALFQVALPDALVLNGEQQATLVSDAELAQQYRAEQGQRIDTGEGHSALARAVSQGAKTSLLVSAASMMRSSLRVTSVSERHRRGQRGVEEQLPELASDDRRSIRAAQEGDGLDMEAFVGDIGENRENALPVSAR
jgi:hypothetical protein